MSEEASPKALVGLLFNLWIISLNHFAAETLSFPKPCLIETCLAQEVLEDFSKTKVRELVSQCKNLHFFKGKTYNTLPETNIAFEHRPLEKEITIIFRGENVSFREGI